MTRRKTNENLADMAGSAEADHELQMARSQLYKIAQYAIKLHEMTKQITDPQGLEPWQSAKLTKASDYLSAVYHNLEYNLKYKPNGEPAGELGAEAGEIAVGESKKKKYGKMKETSDPYHKELRSRLKLAEKAVSKTQQQAAGIALAAKQGEKPVSELKGSAKEMYNSMSEKELKDYAETEHEGLPEAELGPKGRANYNKGGRVRGPGSDGMGPKARKAAMIQRVKDQQAAVDQRDKEKNNNENTYNEAGRGPGQRRRGYNNNLPSAAAQARKAQLRKQSEKEKAEKEKNSNENTYNEGMPSKLRQKLDDIKSGKLDNELLGLEKKAKKFGNKQVLKAISDRRAARVEGRGSEKYEDWATKFVQHAQKMPEFKDAFDIANSAGIDFDFYEMNKREIDREIKNLTGQRNIEQFLKTVG